MSFLRSLVWCFPLATLCLHCGSTESSESAADAVDSGDTTNSTSTHGAGGAAGAAGNVDTGNSGGSGGGSSDAGGGENTAATSTSAGEPQPPDPDGPLTAVLEGEIPYVFGDISGTYPLEVSCLRMGDGYPARFQAYAAVDSFGDSGLPGLVQFEVPHALTGDVDQSSDMMALFRLTANGGYFLIQAGQNRGAFTATISANDMQGAGRFTANGHVTDLRKVDNAPFVADVKFWIDGVFEGGCP